MSYPLTLIPYFPTRFLEEDKKVKDTLIEGIRYQMSKPAAYKSFIENVKYNVPFGYLDNKGEFRAFVNIDIDEDGNYVYWQNGSKHSIPQLISKQKGIPNDKWFEHVVYVNEQGRIAYLHKKGIETVVKAKAKAIVEEKVKSPKIDLVFEELEV